MVFPPAAGESILGSPKELMFNLPPSIRPGGEVEAYVTTSLSADGVFWAQLLEGGREYDALSERLQEVVAEMKGLYTPVFYSPGDICAAMFSGDQLWYRARVERVQGGKVSVIVGGRRGVERGTHSWCSHLWQCLVRFMDFGNVEEREYSHLVSLKSEFRLLPFQVCPLLRPLLFLSPGVSNFSVLLTVSPQAVQCSISTDDHLQFTEAVSHECLIGYMHSLFHCIGMVTYDIVLLPWCQEDKVLLCLFLGSEEV